MRRTVPGRFSNLELRNEREQPRALGLSEAGVARDERHYLPLAQEEYRWGRFEPALRLYTRCLEHNRAVIPAWVGQVQMLVQLDELREARLWADKALELFRNNGELLAAKAQACVRLADLKAGMSCSDASLQAAGSSPWRWTVRGEALLAQSRPQAEACFMKALAEPAADWFDRVVIGRIYLFYRRATNALAYFKQAVEMAPAHGYIWFEMGNAHAALGIAAVARTSFQRCLELRADYREARQALEGLKSMSIWTRVRGLMRARRGR